MIGSIFILFPIVETHVGGFIWRVINLGAPPLFYQFMLHRDVLGNNFGRIGRFFKKENVVYPIIP
jgi:hypothetical protein